MTDKAFVKVTWHDATDDDRTWLREQEIDAFGAEPLVVISWGWLMTKTAQYVTLAADHVVGTDTYGRVTKIPRKMCQTIEEFQQE